MKDIRNPTQGVKSHVRPRSPEFPGGHPKSNSKPNIADSTPGVIVGSQAAKPLEFPGGNPKSRRASGNGAVSRGRPLD